MHGTITCFLPLFEQIDKSTCLRMKVHELSSQVWWIFAICVCGVGVGGGVGAAKGGSAAAESTHFAVLQNNFDLYKPGTGNIKF